MNFRIAPAKFVWYSERMRRHRRASVYILVSTLWLALSLGISAHQPGLSTLTVQVQTNEVTADLIVAWRELEDVVPLDGDQNRELSPDEFTAAKSRLLQLAETATALESDGQMLRVMKVDVTRDDTTGIRFWITCELPETRVLLIRSDLLPDLQRGHKQIILVRNTAGATIAEWVLERERNMLEVPLDAATAPPALDHSIGQYLWLGVEHIAMGWDHLLFLFGLLVVGGSLREAIKIITSFTVAHSLTLALATFDLIRFSSTVVEALIAASILYVGIENILRDNFRGRWILTFVFGLIHGCGFATMLRELGVGANGASVVKPLLFFNLGVELGQVVIAAVMLPLIWQLKPRFSVRWIPVTSAVVILLGGYWLVERTLL